MYYEAFIYETVLFWPLEVSIFQSNKIIELTYKTEVYSLIALFPLMLPFCQSFKRVDIPELIW